MQSRCISYKGLPNEDALQRNHLSISLLKSKPIFKENFIELLSWGLTRSIGNEVHGISSLFKLSHKKKCNKFQRFPALGPHNLS